MPCANKGGLEGKEVKINDVANFDCWFKLSEIYFDLLQMKRVAKVMCCRTMLPL